MKTIVAFAAAVAALALFAAASPPPIHDVVQAQVAKSDGLHVGSKDQPVKIDGVLYIDQRSTASNSAKGSCDGGAGICFTGKGKVDYDFPALNGTVGTLGTVCAVSSNITATGCTFGDQVLLGIDQAPVSNFVTFTPRITAADTAVVQACCVGQTDGGTCNQPDSGFSVRCFR